MAWRNLVGAYYWSIYANMQHFQISFIIKQMRRGFDEERALRKRFSASLMGISSRNSAVFGGPAYNNKSRSFRNMSDFRIASLSSLHTPLPYYSRGRASSTTSTINDSTAQHHSATALMRSAKPAPLNTLAAPMMSNNEKLSPRSASWCTEQEAFSAEFGRLAMAEMGRVCVFMSYS